MFTPMRFALALSFLVACGPPTLAKPERLEPTAADSNLATKINGFVEGHLAFRPNLAIDLGLHDYDGAVPDRSPDAVAAEIARLETARAIFDEIDPAKL